jgi:hypothetical protein
MWKCNLLGGEAELGAVAGGLDPLAGALGGEACAHPDVRADAQLGRRLDHQVELVEAVDHDDRRAPEALGEKRRLHVGAVLVAVAHDQGARGVEHRERDQQLGLGAGLETDSRLGAEADDLLDHVALLVHLDGVDAAEATRVAVLARRRAERFDEALHAAGQDVGEADQQRRAEAALLEVPHQVEQVDPCAGGTARRHLHVAVVADGEVAPPPVGDVVQLEAVLHGPGLKQLGGLLWPASGRSPGAPARAAPYL